MSGQKIDRAHPGGPQGSEMTKISRNRPKSHVLGKKPICSEAFGKKEVVCHHNWLESGFPVILAKNRSNRLKKWYKTAQFLPDLPSNRSSEASKCEWPENHEKT